MITLKNLDHPKSIPAFFNTEKEFIDYTIDEALWISLPTGEIPTMQKWGFSKIVDDIYTEENGSKTEIVHWDADIKTCLAFWNDIPTEKWQVSFK